MSSGISSHRASRVSSSKPTASPAGPPPGLDRRSVVIYPARALVEPVATVSGIPVEALTKIVHSDRLCRTDVSVIFKEKTIFLNLSTLFLTGTK